MDALAGAIGEDRLAIRLTPFGLYNQARGMQRMETWGHLCRQLKKKHNLSYVHFLEPRYEQVYSLEEKNKCKFTCLASRTGANASRLGIVGFQRRYSENFSRHFWGYPFLLRWGME
jgi:2,4-dienoyl-CoA reductase-like NADH-dependent reductase (Old Yellow Enzyme family)